MKTLDPRLAQGGLVVAAAIAVVLSWHHGYERVARLVVQGRAQRNTLARQVRQADDMVRAAGGRHVWMAQAQQRLAQLNAQFPGTDQLPGLLNRVSETVNANNVRLLNVSQGNVETVRDGDRVLTLEGRPCQRLPVTIMAEGRYHAVRAALEQLTQDAVSGVVTVDAIGLRAKDAAGSLLDVTVELSLYVVGSASSAAPSG